MSVVLDTCLQYTELCYYDRQKRTELRVLSQSVEKHNKLVQLVIKDMKLSK